MPSRFLKLKNAEGGGIEPQGVRPSRLVRARPRTSEAAPSSDYDAIVALLHEKGKLGSMHLFQSCISCSWISSTAVYFTNQKRADGAIVSGGPPHSKIAGVGQSKIVALMFEF